MRWSNVSVIFRREVIDQIRDRRTLFMIVVFPILLYPILGYVILQVASAMEKNPEVVGIVGVVHFPKAQPLLNAQQDGFNPRLFDSPAEASLLIVHPKSDEGPWGEAATREQAIRHGKASAVMVIPADLPR